MSAPLLSCTCPGCRAPWRVVAQIEIAGTVEPDQDPEGKAKLGIELACYDCETRYEAWLAFEDFSEVGHVS